MNKTIPIFRTDAEAEHFVDTADLSEYDLSGFTKVRFRFAGADEDVDITVPLILLDAARAKAESLGIGFDHYIKGLIERDIETPQ